MASAASARSLSSHTFVTAWRNPSTGRIVSDRLCYSSSISAVSRPRYFSSSSRFADRQHKESFFSRLRIALANTKIQWAPIPVGLGIGFLGLLQFSRVQQREKERQQEEEAAHYGGNGSDHKPRKRERVRPSGPWQVQIMSTLPLKAISRLWGKFNELQIPYYLRVPGFKLYSWIFGANLDEVAEPDLHVYPNLAAFFYRELKPGVRPLDPNPNALLSPADGKVIQFGSIAQGGEVEQVKGITYSLDSLLGSQRPVSHTNPPGPSEDSSHDLSKPHTRDGEQVHADQEFAQVNGISYTLPNLFSGRGASAPENKISQPTDQSTKPKASSESEVTEDFATSEAQAVRPWWSPFSSTPTTPTQLYYIVVYLAPGDYHRFHSPVSWVVSQRRHFAGELYSVSPYLQRTLPGLFTLNERVVLLGRWRWGFFSYTPVGATNVGSIVVNFDRELRTNSLLTDTAADRAAEEAKERGEPYSGFSEASYETASPTLGGHALKRGEEMGGFQLGSTIVLVFEAPKGRRKSFDEGYDPSERKGGWHWNVKNGQSVKMGQALGQVIETD